MKVEKLTKGKFSNFEFFGIQQLSSFLEELPNNYGE